MPTKKPRLSPEEALSQIAAKYQHNEKIAETVGKIIDEIRSASEDCVGQYMIFARQADRIFSKYSIERLFTEVGLNAAYFEERVLRIFRR